LSESEESLVPWDRVASVFPMARVENIEGALTSYHSFFVKGSTTRLPPFFPLDRRFCRWGMMLWGWGWGAAGCCQKDRVVDGPSVGTKRVAMHLAVGLVGRRTRWRTSEARGQVSRAAAAVPLSKRSGDVKRHCGHKVT